MVFTRFCFVYFYPLILAQFPQHLSDIFPYFPVYYLSPVFRCKYYVVLTFPLRVC